MVTTVTKTRGRAERRQLKNKHNPIAKKLRQAEFKPKVVEVDNGEKGGAKNLLKEYIEGKLDDI